MEMDEMESGGGVLAVADLARKSVIEVTTGDGREYVLVSRGIGNGYELKDITAPGHLPSLPATVCQHVRVDTKNSFVDYVNAFKTSTTRVFAALNPKGSGEFVAELDYHRGVYSEAKQELQGVEPLPSVVPAQQHRRHRATFVLQDSEEWARWSAISGKLMDQGDFVRFLEENSSDIAAPSGADILELVKDFSANRKVDFRQALRTETGDVSFEYAPQVEARNKQGGAIEVPRMFRLSIPVFFGEPPTEVNAFLRWRLREGEGLQLGIELHRPLFVRQAVFHQIGDEVRSRTVTPLHYGAPH